MKHNTTVEQPKRQLLSASDINNTGMSGIIDVSNMKVYCYCDADVANEILEALRLIKA